MVAIINTQWPQAVAERLWSATTEIALLLFGDSLYMLGLQVIAVLLTAAVIGGVFLAKREDLPDPGDRERPEQTSRRRPSILEQTLPPRTPVPPPPAERRYTAEAEQP